MRCNRFVLFAIVAPLLALAACRGDGSRQASKSQLSEQQVKEEFERAERLSAARSGQQIESYIRRHEIKNIWYDPAGYYFQITGRPTGSPLHEGDQVLVAYRATLLDGAQVEMADSISPAKMTIGRRDKTAGLDMLLLRMLPGQQGMAIVPAYLAYGLRGVGDKIPANSCLVYYVDAVEPLP